MILPRSDGHSANRVISVPEKNMKTKKELDSSIVRNNYTHQFKEQVLECADKVGKDLGLI